jgi:hypothetical protein
MTKLKPFQEATVNAVIEAFRAKSASRRFLVADEVGLGKTVIAQHVIKALMKGRRKPLIVFYICSSLTIASQNKRKLLEILPEDEREMATCPVDRLTLMPAAPEPKHRTLHFYSLSPETSVPLLRGSHRDGRQEERALIHALVELLWPRLSDELGHNFFRRRARVYWAGLVKDQRNKIANNVFAAFRQNFVRSIRREFNLTNRQKISVALRSYKDRPLELIAHFRNALAASTIEKIHPDLVIFDEFQRFKELLNTDLDDAAARVILRLRGEGRTKRSALLLLSATPYSLYSQRLEDKVGASHHVEFFDLVEFLYGGDKAARRKREDCEKAFAELEQEFRKGRLKSKEAQQARSFIQQMLRPILSRTERASLPEGWADQGTQELPADLQPADLKIYQHLSNSFDERHRLSAVSYWTSIPLPLQTMGPRYIAWKDADVANTHGVPSLNLAKRNGFKGFKSWPHPRLRAMQELTSNLKLSLPWMSPSLPWWRLKGKRLSKDLEPSKILTFSRFRASPQAIAAFISFDLENSLFKSQGISYQEITRRRSLTATGNRHLLLGFFHPSPWLIMSTDPLSGC